MPSLADLTALHPVHLALTGSVATLGHALLICISQTPCCWGVGCLSHYHSAGVSIFVIQLEACNSQKK